MKNSGLLVVLSGFAGTGKGTLVKKLISDHPDKYALSVSATTRAPRPGEREGIEYFFKTSEEFGEMIAKGELLEYARYLDNYYGTPRSYVEDRMAEGKNVLLEIEVQGGLKVKEEFPDTLLLFVIPPSAKALVERLRGRGSETDAEIYARLNRAIEEAEECRTYDYLIVNDDLEDCAETIHQIIQTDRSRMKYSFDDLQAIKEDLEKYVKGEQI